MTYFPSLETLREKYGETGKMPPHIITDFGGGGDMQLFMHNGIERRSIFFRCSGGGGISTRTCGGIGWINSQRCDKTPVNNVEIGKTIWRPGDDGGGFLACKMQDIHSMIMTIISTDFGDTEIISVLVVRDMQKADLPIIALGKTYDLLAQLPHFMLADWEEPSDHLKSFRGKTLLATLETGERFVQPVCVNEKIHRILEAYHSV